MFASCGLVSLFGCVVSDFSCLLFFIPFEKRPQKTGHCKQKNKNAGKEDKIKIQLAQLSSQIVFLIFGGGLEHAQKIYFAKSPMKIVVSAYFEKKKEKRAKNVTKVVKNLTKVESKICPSMLRNISGQIFDTKKW